MPGLIEKHENEEMDFLGLEHNRKVLFLESLMTESSTTNLSFKIELPDLNARRAA